MLDERREQAVELFKRLVSEPGTDDKPARLETEAPRHIGDADATVLIRKLAGVKHCHDVCALPKEKRDEVFEKLKRHGCSIRQIARLTGANRGIVYAA
jgi:hypothetical protein